MQYSAKLSVLSLVDDAFEDLVAHAQEVLENAGTSKIQVLAARGDAPRIQSL